MDFGFDFDELKIDDEYVYGTLLKQNSKQRFYFNPDNEVKQLRALMPKLPKYNEVFKLMSVRGGFSSLSLIMRVAEVEQITAMYCSTFRIGKKHFDRLKELHENNRLGNCYFLTSKTQENTDKITGYDYFDYIQKNLRAWKIKAINNHSKVILMKTKNNFYVVETSSNLNENPQIEQFSFENDEELFNWHLKLFKTFFKEIKN